MDEDPDPEDLVPAESVNPYASPQPPEEPRDAPAVAGARKKEPFSAQAAKFSFLAPFMLLILGFCIQSQIVRPQDAQQKQQQDAGRQVSIAIGVISAATTALAIVFGCVGLVGGILRRNFGTIFVSILGLLLNGGLIAALVMAYLAVRERFQG